MKFNDDSEMYSTDYIRLNEEKIENYNYDRSGDPADQLAERVVVAVVRGAGEFPVQAGAVIGIATAVLELVEIELMKQRMELTLEESENND